MKRDKSFVYGVATAAYQIEGAISEDGRVPSVWDTYCTMPGRIYNGDSGDIACDHYHRYKEDIALMAELGVNSYRFSIAWSRIYSAKGVYNENGMRFYRDILAELKKYNIAPSVTLYHFDLPQWAQDLGGWENRECAEWYNEYARKCFDELGADVPMWITHNEPWCASFLSYMEGTLAPGYTNMEKALKAAHHQLLSHGMAIKSFREMGLPGQIGITLNPAPIYAESGSFRDDIARTAQDGYRNRWFFDPLFGKGYPRDIAMLFAARCGTSFDFIQVGDSDVISTPIDFLGLNFYSHTVVRYRSSCYLLNEDGHTDLPKTDMGWDICPETLVDLIQRIRLDYTDIPIYITENGCALKDCVEDGAIHDSERADYILRHLETIRNINRKGLNIKGYYCWTLMDNFEWACGYGKRFGLVYVDYETQQRIPKDSFYAYKGYIEKNPDIC